MPAAPAVSPMPPQKRWTRAECTELERAGLLDSEGYELVAGALVGKVSKNYPHLLAVGLLADWLRSAFPGRLRVLQEASIDVSPEDNQSSEPEPDAAALRIPFDQLGRKARPEDILLLVEIASTSLSFDLGIKANLYARAGFADYWVLDVITRRLIVHRDRAVGVYRSVIACEAGESVTPLAAPQAAVRAADFLGA